MKIFKQSILWGLMSLFALVYADVRQEKVQQESAKNKKFLIVPNAEVNVLDRNGQIALIGIIKKIYPEFIGPCVNCCTNIRPRHVKERLPSAEFLIESGADVVADPHSELLEAAIDGRFENVRPLINAVNIDAVDANGNTVLIWASMYGNLDMVKYLTERGANPDIQNQGGYTALIWASMHGYLEIVKYLVEHGADLYIQNQIGESPLSVAERYGKTQIVRFLLDF